MLENQRSNYWVFNGNAILFLKSLFKSVAVMRVSENLAQLEVAARNTAAIPSGSNFKTLHQ